MLVRNAVSKLTTVAASVALTAGLTAVGAGALRPADAATATPARAATGSALHCHRGSKALPASLRTDLRHARALPVGGRGPALRAIRAKALRGSYGAAAQQWAVHRIRHQARVAAHRPATLRRDLRHVRTLPAAQRPAARRAIRAKVLSGGYGAAAQQRAQQVTAHREACRAQRS